MALVWRQTQETADHLPVLRLLCSQMGLITSCLAPTSSGGGWGGSEGVKVKGHDPTLPEYDLRLSNKRLESACDNGDLQPPSVPFTSVNDIRTITS